MAAPFNGDCFFPRNNCRISKESNCVFKQRMISSRLCPIVASEVIAYGNHSTKMFCQHISQSFECRHGDFRRFIGQILARIDGDIFGGMISQLYEIGRNDKNLKRIVRFSGIASSK